MKLVTMVFTRLVLCSFTLLASLHFGGASNHHPAAENVIQRLIRSRSSPKSTPSALKFITNADGEYVNTHQPQDGSMELDKINALPGQPNGVDFNQYAGYVTVDDQAGRALFYYFVESPENSSTNPLVLWLNGGPGCSSLGAGAMTELGPFRVNGDGKTLDRNPYAWNNVANVIFLESPAGVGFSYSNTSSDYAHAGDNSTAADAYTFLERWLDRFPQYKTRDFFIAGESYAGHYVPQLADTILSHNKNANQTIINLKGVAIGNGVLNDPTDGVGGIEFYWSHALISDESYKGIFTNCDFSSASNSSELCDKFLEQAGREVGDIYGYNIYAPFCAEGNNTQANPTSSVANDQFDPCSSSYVDSYLNAPEVQTALHANQMEWSLCRRLGWTDSPSTVLPLITDLMASGIKVWIYSGDIDGVVPITSTRYSISSLNLPVKTPWYPWYISNDEVGGYVEGYEGLTFVTVRGAGHFVPSYQPRRALVMISAFLQATLPPPAST